MSSKSLSVVIILVISSIGANAQFTAISGSPVTTDGVESSGAAWVDYDNDGYEDLFVITTVNGILSTKPLLYKNNKDGTFTRVTTGTLVNQDGVGRNSTWADFNNDGLIDVMVVNQLQNFLYKNTGGGVFVQQSSVPTTSFSVDSDHAGAVWGDFNGDGYVDLYLASYQLSAVSGNILYLNNKDETFTQLPASNVVSALGYSVDPAAIDYDNNGTQDLFVPNYCIGTNYLYNNGGLGNFTAVTGNALLSSSCSVGSSWADFDNDGDFDVVIQNNVNQSNLFFENNGDGSFTQRVNAITSHTSSSAAWGDFDNDGFIDLVQVGSFPERRTYLYRNNGDKTFTDVSDQQNTNFAGYSRAVAWADYDKDGFLDFFIANGDTGPPFSINDVLYHNTPNGNGWINIKLTGTVSNRSAIGAVVKIKAGGKWQYRTVQSKTGFNSENSLNVHFGFGTAANIDSLQVWWPNQGYQVLLNPTKNVFMEIQEISLPKSPALVSVANTIPNEVKLNWTDNSGNETGFRIERAKGSPKNFSLLTTVASNVTSFSDNQIQEGVTYYYRVAATISGGYSNYSNLISVVTKKKQSVTFQPIGSKFLDSPPFQLIATATSGLPVSFKIMEGKEKVSLKGTELSIVALGSSRIGAFQSGNDSYYASDTTSQSLNVTLVTGLGESAEIVSVYPNPVIDNLTVEARGTGINQLKLVNMQGQVLYSAIRNNSEEETISCHELPPGLYVLSVDNRRFKVLKR